MRQAFPITALARLIAWWLPPLICLAVFTVVAAGGTHSVTRAQLWLAADPADVRQVGDLRPPGPAATWSEVALPYQWSRSIDRPGVAWFRFSVALSGTPPADPALYLSRLSVGGVFFVNGTRIAGMRGSDEATQMRWRRPHMVDVPPGLLKSGRNEFLVRIVSRDAETFFPEVKFGETATLQVEYDRRYLYEYTGAQFSALTSAVVAAFMLAIWWFRRTDLLYLLFGLTCGFWSLRTWTYLTESVPWAWWWEWRAMYNVWTGCFALSVAAFFLSYIDRLVRHWRAALLAYAFGGPLLLLLSNGALQTVVARYWIGGLFVLELYVLWRFALWLRRNRSIEGIGLAGAALATFLLAANDFGVRSGWLPYSNPYAIHFGAPVVMLAMGALLAARFVRALKAVEHSNTELTRKVAEKERELARQYDQLRAAERLEAQSAERQRIMQDMHDGLGSQLLTSLAAVERGALDPRGVAQVLRDAMDEMRLAIDTLAPGSEGLLEALGNLRYRLEPRFRAAGVELVFTRRDLPETLAVPAEDALQILRVLQESLTNVLKHAGARRVEVTLACANDPHRFVLQVADDGHGFGTTAPAQGAGRGLSGMRRRASRIGAQLDVNPGPTGTHIRLAYPLQQPG